MKSHFIPADFSSQNQEHVFQLQEALLLFYKDNATLIASLSNEIKERIFGENTRNALISFQEETDNKLSATGRLNSDTIEEINLKLSKYNKILGTIRDIAGTPLEGVTVKIFAKDVKIGTIIEDVEIGTSISFNDGSYCVFFPFLSENIRRSKSGVFQIIVKLSQNESTDVSIPIFVEKMGEDIVFDFTSKILTYQGTSVYEDIKKDIEDDASTNPTLNTYILSNSTNGVPATIVENIIYLSKISGNTTDSIVKYIIANKISKSGDFKEFNIPVELFFAFLYQNYPVSLPKNIIPETDLTDEEEIVAFLGNFFTSLEETARIGIVLLYDGTNGSFNTIISKAIKLHYITNSNYDYFYNTISTIHDNYILGKPLLIGENNTITSKIRESDPDYKSQVAKLFIANQGDIIAFRKAIKNTPNLINTDLTEFELAGVTQNHSVTIVQISDDIEDPNTPNTNLSDYTKNELSELITTFPEEFENKDSYVKDISLNIQKLYPVESYFTHIEKLHKEEDPGNGIINYSNIKEFILNPVNKIDLLNQDVNEKDELGNDIIPENLKNNFKIIQQVYRISPTPATAGALINEKIHSVKYIYLLGRSILKEKLSKRNISDEEVDMLFSMTTARYANALAAYSNINANFNQIEPLAISKLSQEKLDKSRGQISETSIEILINDLKESDDFKNTPDIETLFGSTDYCDCQHCQSVYSPSAYLADVLTFLESKPAESSFTSAENVLTAPNRRGDIEAIKLNCQNTDTPMPYIDLACEILEENIYASGIDHQTTLTAEELKAMPEHVNKAAYSKLRDTAYPMNSSFNLWQEESRTYLNKMGIKRYELMEAFKGSDIDIAAEYFGLTTIEKEIITCTGTGVGIDYTNIIDRNKIWTKVTIDNTDLSGNKKTILITDFLRDTGLNCNEVLELKDVQWLNISINLDDNSCTCDDKVITFNDADTLDNTHRIIRLWRKSGYKMWELDLLLSKKGIYGEIDALVVLDAQFLINLKKFDELKKLLNLSFENVLALYNPINTETRKVNGINEIALYNRLFLNNNLKKIVNSESLKVEIIFNSLSIDQNGKYIFHNSVADQEYPDFIKKVITVAYTISESDYLLIIKDIFSNENTLLSIENLSKIYRYIIFAKQLKLPISDFIDLKKIIEQSSNNTVAFNTVEKTLNFIKTFNEIKDVKLSIDELKYLTNSYEFSAIDDYPLLAASNSYYFDLLKKLREDLLPVFEKFNTATDTINVDDNELVKRLIIKLPLVLNDFYTVNSDHFYILDDFINFNVFDNNSFFTIYLSPFIKDIEAAIVFFNTESDAIIRRDYILKNLLRYFTIKYLSELQTFNNKNDTKKAIDIIEGKNNISDIEKNSFISLYFGTLKSNTIYLQNYLWQPSYLLSDVEIIERYKIVFEFLFQYNLNNKISEIFGISKNVSDNLLEEIYFKNDSAPTALNLYSYFSNPSFFQKNSTGIYTIPIDFTSINSIKALYRSLQQIYRTNLLINKFKISEVDLQWLVLNQNILDYLPWQKIQTISGNNISSNYNLSAFLKFIKLLNLKNKYGAKNDISLFNVVEKHTSTSVIGHQALLKDLSDLTGWELDSLTKICTHLSFVILDPPDTSNPNVVPSTSLYSPETYEKIENCFNLINIAGADADTVIKWANRAETEEEAVTEKIIIVLKSKYSYEQWLTKLPPIQKGIREKKCHALSVYLIEHSQRTTSTPAIWYDTNDLYGYFLIDTEMSACQFTSRIKMAISSVQLFVQRCLLNLEPKVKTELIPEWKQWKWMKNYRIWEANRKVFLYPENWIYPELRDDKTPFFVDLENELNQNDITADYAEEVFGNYLQKLHEVSNLEIAGIYHEEDINVDILHVIGRTRSNPHTYYYRKCDGNTKVWNAWEKMEIDIKSETVVPIVYNCKLYLFWLVNNSQEKVKISAGGEVMFTRYQLAWSKRNAKGWSKVKNSKKMHYDCVPDIWVDPKTNIKYTFERNILLKPLYIAETNELFFEFYTDYFRSDNLNRFYESLGCFKFNGEVFDVLSWIPNDWKSDFVKSINQSKRPNFFNDIKTIFINYNYVITNNIYHKIYPESNVSYLFHLSFGNVYNFNLISLTSSDVTDSSIVFALQDANPEQDMTNFANHPFFYQDTKRVLLFKKEWVSEQNKDIIHIYPFSHPFTALFNRELNKKGLEGMLNREIQVNPNSIYDNKLYSFEYRLDNANPEISIAPLYDNADGQIKKIVDFNFGGPFSTYNWELFFHAPLYIACKLSQNQKFEEAMQWFHYIFNPTNVSKEADGNDIPQRYWITKPFFEMSSADYKKQNISEIIKNSTPEQINAWLNDPFKPHLIARYRPVAYERTVVMKYIDNLIAWGDQLFKRDTIESINEATMLYVLAYEILGPKPVKHPSLKLEEKTYHEMITTTYHEMITTTNNLDIITLFDESIQYKYKKSIEKLSIANHEILSVKEQNTSRALICNTVQFHDTDLPVQTTEEHRLPQIDPKHFCIPANDILLSYWDLVEDRLYKIRNCMNIKGIVRLLPLFEPPIDPALLVRAAAAGLDFGSVLDDLSVPHPHYRFRVMLQKAVEFCGEVKQLGEKLLAAIEKKDAESLSLLRSVQEINVLNAVKQVRKLQIQEATESAKSLEKTMQLTEEKKNYYESKEFMNTLESMSFGLVAASAVLETIASTLHATASVVNLVPESFVGVNGISPVAVTNLGGKKPAESTKSVAESLAAASRNIDKYAGLIGTMANYKRRKEDWDFQAKMAEMEMVQIDKQILAAEIRQQIAEKELENQDLQIEQAKTSDTYYKSKFSNEQLYNWMLSQISNIYFQSYQLAYEMAKKAEKAYRYELGITDNEQFINFGYWDSLKKGLLAGDLLMFDLHQLDAAYIENNSREYELSKHISLAQMFPDKLIDLVTKGESFINLPEWLFNMDYPGHYMRRIKSISISIPNVAGPYTNVNCTLSLLKSKMRINSDLKANPSDSTKPIYIEETPDVDNRFIEKLGVVQSIATSHGQNDSGLFELNFNDERYLPFEGAGAISDWKISLPKDSNQFDLASISDVIIHINYTAREGGDMLAAAAKSALTGHFKNENSMMLFSLKHDFPTEWNSFIQNSNHILEFTIKDEHLPYYAKLIKPNNISNVEGVFIPIGADINIGTVTINKLGVTPLVSGNSIIASNKFGINLSTTCQGNWRLSLTGVTGAYDDIILIVSFKTT